jgi:acyl-CoA thioesterase FadM
MLNRDLLPENTCFGCGHANHAGLRIEIVRDDKAVDLLRGCFVPTMDMAGFPGITTWVATLLGPNRTAGWLLRQATTTYHKPAPAGEKLALTGRIREQGGPWDALIVHTEARRADGALCVEGDFKVIPVSPEKLAQLTGVREIPENWKYFLSDAAD